MQEHCGCWTCHALFCYTPRCNIVWHAKASKLIPNNNSCSQVKLGTATFPPWLSLHASPENEEVQKANDFPCDNICRQGSRLLLLGFDTFHQNDNTNAIKVSAAYHAKIIIVCRKVTTDHNLTAPLSSGFGLKHFSEQNNASRMKRLAAEVQL